MFLLTVVKWTIVVIIMVMAHDNNRIVEMSIPSIPTSQ